VAEGVGGMKRIRFKFTSDYPLKYGANAAAEFDNPDWPRFVRITDVTANGNLREDTFRSLPPEVARGYELEEGDILLARSGATVGKTFIYEPSWGKACYAGYLIRSRTSDSHWPKFIYWYFQSARYWAEIESNLIQATIQNFSAEKYANIRIPSFPLETQKRIAAFLDEKTAQIDGLIEKKRALLERLAEKRQAIITQAVTKGLNPAASMKDSGIDWLGQVPAHWEVRSLRRLVHMKSGETLTSSEIEEDGAYPVYGGNGFRGYTENYNTTGELVLIGRQGEHCGNIHRISGVTYVTEHSLRCFPEKALSARWLEALLTTMKLRQHSVSAAQPGLSAERLGALMTVYAPPEEQIAIGEYIENRIDLLKGIEKPIITSLDRLTEYRSALITAAVTGQIEGLR
jgi:type I restriction enzyme S subunit